VHLSWVLVARVGRPHGIKGEITVELHTDSPQLRFADGAQLHRDEAAPLVVESTRWHQGTLLVRFDGYHDRTLAESIRGAMLYVDPSSDPPSEDGSFADRELVGLTVLLDGVPIAEVTEVIHPPGSDLLAARTPGGRELLIPFVMEVVPEVDLVAGTLRITPPEGLLEL
jgi:16S rRNA processing protein RimM